MSEPKIITDNTKVNAKLIEENEALRAHVERLKKAKLCLNHNSGCLNDGIIPVQIGEDEWEPQQCAFCYTEPESLFNVRNETPAQSLEAIKKAERERCMAVIARVQPHKEGAYNLALNDMLLALKELEQ